MRVSLSSWACFDFECAGAHTTTKMDEELGVTGAFVLILLIGKWHIFCLFVSLLNV